MLKFRKVISENFKIVKLPANFAIWNFQESFVIILTQRKVDLK